jgi:hypothetical protein
MRFGREHTPLLDEALYVAEHTCADYFKLGGAGWKALRFELGTRSTLWPGEGTPLALAKLARYEPAHPRLPSAAGHLYRICLQDGPILRLARRDDLDLAGLLTYVLTHELVHIVRFNRFEHLFEAAPGERSAEERRVHQITYDILRPLRAPGLSAVLERYTAFRPAPGLQHCLWSCGPRAPIPC